MDVHHVKFGRSATHVMREEDMMDIRKGPWTAEEDSMLFNYINLHGEGRWNAVARCAGLKRTGKSCRLRWLNYLRPDVRRGNITLQEQLMILEFHSRWGNRWSKIAQHLPGRTDNEIKNYWRTRVQKQAKQLKCDVNSKQFRDAMRNVWIPRLVERIQASSESHSSVQPTTATATPNNHMGVYTSGSDPINPNLMPAVSDSSEAQLSSISDITECGGKYPDDAHNGSGLIQQGMDIQVQAYEYSNGWLGGGGDSFESMLSDENMWYLHQQLFDDQV